MIFIYSVIAIFFALLMVLFLSGGPLTTDRMAVAVILFSAILGLFYLMQKRLVRKHGEKYAVKESVMPTFEQSRWVVFLIAALGILMGAVEVFNLINQSGSNHSTRFMRLLHNTFGPWGPILFFVGGGAFLLYFLWRRNRK